LVCEQTDRLTGILIFVRSDQQVCELRFGSWTYNQRQLNFSYYDDIERRVTIKDYVVSGSWDLLDGPMSIQQSSNESNSTMEKTYRRDRVEFVCKLVIRRKTLFYTVNLIIPTVNQPKKSNDLFLVDSMRFVFLLCRFLGIDFVSIDFCLLLTNGCR
jgi:hypothetical protein